MGTVGCLEDNTIMISECAPAIPFCAPCFPNSSCGNADVVVLAGAEDDSALFVESESESCGPESPCSETGSCFDHAIGCAEDGSFAIERCVEALPCAPCLPNSRCGGEAAVAEAGESEPAEEEAAEEEATEEEAAKESPETEASVSEAESGAHFSGVESMMSWTLALFVGAFSWCSMQL